MNPVSLHNEIYGEGGNKKDLPPGKKLNLRKRKYLMNMLGKKLKSAMKHNQLVLKNKEHTENITMNPKTITLNNGNIDWKFIGFGDEVEIWRTSDHELILKTKVFFEEKMPMAGESIDRSNTKISHQNSEKNSGPNCQEEENADLSPGMMKKVEPSKIEIFQCQFCPRVLANRDSRIKHERLSCKAEGAPNHKCVQSCRKGCKGALEYKRPDEKKRGRKTDAERAELAKEKRKSTRKLSKKFLP